MTDPKEKRRPPVPTRTPKKKTQGIFDNLRQLPHPVEEFLNLGQEEEARPKQQDAAPPSLPSDEVTTVQPTPPTPLTAGTAGTPPTSNNVPSPVAPARDFTRVANSIVREAVPSGVFAGKSKQLYDFLYSRTRGAVVPVRSVRITKEALMRGAGIGSERTLYKNLRRLVSVGLVNIRSLGGEHAGSEYTVMLPEEAARPTPPTPPTDTTHTSQKVETLPTAQSGVSGVGINVDTEKSYGEPKTSSFKTNTNDDEAVALSDLNALLSEAARKLTGRAPRAGEREQWAELARVLVEELNEAAARAGSVSSVPAFLAAHLRRKLAPKLATRKREGNQPPTPALPVQPANLNRRLTPEEIAEQARIIADLLEGGYSPEQAEEQFSGSFHTDDWSAIRDAATANNALPEK